VCIERWGGRGGGRGGGAAEGVGGGVGGVCRDGVWGGGVGMGGGGLLAGKDEGLVDGMLGGGRKLPCSMHHHRSCRAADLVRACLCGPTAKISWISSHFE